MDPIEKVFDVNALLSSVTPAQLFMIFVLPVFLLPINKKLVAFFTKIYKLAPIEEAPKFTVANHTPHRLLIFQALMPFLELFTKPFRLVLILFFFLCASSYASTIWVYADIDPSRSILSSVYLIYFLIALGYNILALSKRQESETRIKIQRILGHIYIPIMYVLVFVALYFLVFENFFSLLVYSRIAQGLPVWMGILLLSGLLIPSMVILRDMLQPNPKGVQAILALLLCSCVVCYLLMIAGFCFKTS